MATLDPAMVTRDQVERILRIQRELLDLYQELRVPELPEVAQQLAGLLPPGAMNAAGFLHPDFKGAERPEV